MKRSAFSLIEIITILFIVSLALVGILSLIIQNIQSQSYNKNNLIAYQLAQEGVELVRKVRDSNWLSAFSKPLNLVLPNGKYYMDYRDNKLHVHNIFLPGDLILRRDAAGFYIHGKEGDGVNSGFSRLITLEDSSSSSVRVKVRVSWLDHKRKHNYELETILYNWK